MLVDCAGVKKRNGLIAGARNFIADNIGIETEFPFIGRKQFHTDVVGPGII